jgi:poly(hydroxyalkanoate) depolymerase family esterase
MKRNWILSALLVGALGVLAVPMVQAAQLTQVTADWTGGATFPSDVSMYIYVPDKVATNPPILLLSHFCGGSACDAFSQAQGNGTTDGGIVQAADKYGFIMVAPSNAPPSKCSYPNGRCWDVTSSTAQKRDGKGDPQAIQQMVKYAIDKYKANPDRVYATGDSSGAMMTELLLALYPEMFKAGAAFAGVPAGCTNIYDGSGQCGLPAQTAQQWGDRVRAMDPGYTGPRPRVQLFHGDADGTITYKNLAQAINEWTNVLGLSATPTSTASGLTLGTHQATRQSWKNSCGYVILDAVTSIGGDHGPSDALFEGSYVLPFMGLDSQTAVNAAVDPEIAQCGGGTDGGASGVGGGSGAGGGGGSSAGRDGGVGGSTGNAGSGGNVGGSGGSTGSGGGSSNGGASGTGGSQSSGGIASGGAQGSGGAVGAGGKSSTGGSAGSGTGGASGNGGAAGDTAGGGVSSGCSCTFGKANVSEHFGIAALAVGLTLVTFARRRRGKP